MTDTGAGTPLTAEEFHDEWVNRGMFCTGTHAVGEALCQNVAATIAYLEATRPATDPAGLDETRRALGVALDRLAEYVAIHDGGDAELFDTTEDKAFIREARPLASRVARLSVADGPGPEERLRAAAEVWLLNYSEVEEYADGERGCTQLDHGHEEYEQRMDLIVALRAAVEETGRS